MHVKAGDGEGYQRRVGTVVLAGLVLLLLLLGMRLVHINTAMAERLLAVLEGQHTGTTPVPARRGLIFDCQGRLVAGSEAVASVFADPHLVVDLPTSAALLAEALHQTPGEVEDIIRQSETPRFCWIKRRIAKAEADAVAQLGLPGVGLVDESIRRYPLGASLAHVLGFVGSDGAGLAGVELQFNDHLRGHDGRISSIRDVRRRAIWRREEGSVEVVDGGHLMLTIDSAIQSAVEEQLAARVKEYAAESGVAVVMRAQTGEILALASYPTFEPANYSAYPPDAWRNRTVVDPIEPGSTFKPIVAGGALAAGKVSTTESIFCHNGVYATTGRVIRDTHPHGTLNLEGIIAKSSNVGMAIIGQRTGNALLYEIVRQFGFGVPCGLELPGESGGRVRPLKQWSALTTTSVPMGYEVGVTPVQLATAYCALVNGGVLLKPRIVRAVLGPDGTPREVFDQPEALRRVLPERVARFLAEKALVAVVEGGDDKPEPSPYPMLGKTGTAKLTRPGHRGYITGAYLSLFVGAAPVGDPQLVVMVAIRKPDPRRGYYGRTVAMPAARRIFDAALAYLEVPPSSPVAASPVALSEP
jgi:cell division protein FtsI (penicillin-binding protein 3)